MAKEKQEKSKEQKNTEKEASEASNGANEEEQQTEKTSTMVALTFDEYDALEKQIETLQAEVEEQKDGWLRSRAELDNYRKRVQRDAARSYQDAMANVLKIFISVADDLERALKNKPEYKETESWVNGIELILQKLQSQMKNQGVERLEVKPGDTFDPNIHEAITQEENPDFEEGQIIEVVQPGYRISDRIIRPAMVRVAS
jgi:molecular chaperone GrpE